MGNDVWSEKLGFSYIMHRINKNSKNNIYKYRYLTIRILNFTNLSINLLLD